MRRKLDLRTGRPVWFAYRAPPSRRGKLTRDVKADVAIVGMGISGAMMAEALTARGHSVDRDRPARPDEGLDGSDDGAGAVRDRPATDEAVAT